MAFGCGEETGRAAGKKKLLPVVDQGVSIVIEAESGAVEPAMVVEEYKSTSTSKSSSHRASGGKCVSVPKAANAACKDGKKQPKGKVTLTFTVPKDGKYYIYPRCWWADQCGNSFGMLIDGKNPFARAGSRNATKPMMVTGSSNSASTWTD